MMNQDDRAPRELFVYECRGPRFPRNEPRGEGFMGIWPEAPFYYVFFDRPAESSVKEWLDTLDGWILKSTYRLDYHQWQQASQQDHRVGPFLICTKPDHEGESPSTEGVVIRLNPSVVFGSGLHATTRGCLLAIAELFGQSVRPHGVVDLGTGTGILALACALLGAPGVCAVDCNLLAVQVAQRNVQANGVQKQVSLIVAQELGVLHGPFDLLTMNLEWPCLKQVLRGEDWLKYRWVILSGFLNTQWHELKALVPPAYQIMRREVLDDWVTVVVRHP